MQYLPWLVSLSLAFAVIERLRPARTNQRVLRAQLGNDLFYLVFNGHFYALLAGGAVGWVSGATRSLLDSVSLLPEAGLIADLPLPAQFVVALVASDFLQWCVHVLLHRVPLLWQFHKVHHSIHSMDWIGNFRFHWMEIVVYRSLLYIPTLMLGASGEAVFWAAVFSTAWGHFNHANLDVGLGPLAYVFNSPRMHLWHHDASTEGGTSKNYGIVFSLWDFVFRTVYWPRDRAPQRLGYGGDRDMPRDLVRQLAFPLTRSRE